MLNTNAVSIDELRSNLADIVNRVTYAKDRIVVKKYNRDAAIIISLDEYERLIDPTKRLSDIEWKNRVKKLDKIRAGMPQFDPQEMEKAIDETVDEVRVEKKASEK
jgi:antitoxin YefM